MGVSYANLTITVVSHRLTEILADAKMAPDGSQVLASGYQG
jgi:hypothetical protein